jgi:hypothetical protein
VKLFMQKPLDFRVAHAQKICQLAAQFGTTRAAKILKIDRSEVYRAIGENPDLACEAGFKFPRRRNKKARKHV